MNKLNRYIAAIVLATLPLTGVASDWNSNPNNWDNNPNNWDNNPNNWKNNPNNWDNNPNRYGNERIIRDEQGNASGYYVPKSDGGANIYDFNGKRRGYVPGER